MKHSLFRKGLVFATIVLFIVAGVLPITGAIKNFEKFNIVMNSTSMDTITVDDEGDGDYIYIQDAIENANLGDTIKVYSGTYIENVVVDKQLTIIGIDEELGIGDDVGKPIIDGGGNGDVVYISADWVDITKFTIQNSGTYYPDAGIEIYSSNNNTITGNNISGNNHYGIHGWHSSYNIITGNNISNNADNGINVLYASYNIITGNNISNNALGIDVGFASYNIITGNNISNNNENILIAGSSSSNTITGNNISNSYQGIQISGSSYNIITGNNISNNKYLGIYMHSSSNNNIITWNNISGNNMGISSYFNCRDNILYLNNFIENNYTAWDTGTNQWDNGSIGNYWDDYHGKDSNGDGIGDTPYYVPPYITGSKDRYPIMKEQKSDTIPPEVSIKKPSEGYLYIFNVEICPTRSGVTKIYGIGGIDIEVDARDHESGMHHVEFYIDNVKKGDEYHVSGQVTCTWLWDETMFGEEHTIKAVAYDLAGNTATDELTVTVFNLHLWSPP